MNNNKYLQVAPSISQADTEAALRTWLRSAESVKPALVANIKILSVEDIHLPMSVTCVESAGEWRLEYGVFQDQKYDRAMRLYENERELYLEEEEKYVSSREAGGHSPVALMPQRPKRDDYFEHVSEAEQYKLSFNGIYRAFNEEILAKAQGLSVDIVDALDKLLRKGFPKAEAVTNPPVPVEQQILTAQIEDQVNGRGFEYAKQQVQAYKNAKNLVIANVNYQSECNIVFLPIRVIEYFCAGKTYIAVTDPVRNDYVLGVRPEAGQSISVGMLAAASAVVILMLGGTTYWKFSGGGTAVQAPVVQPQSLAVKPALPPVVAPLTVSAPPAPVPPPVSIAPAPAKPPAPPAPVPAPANAEINIAPPAPAAVVPASPAPSVAVPALSVVAPNPVVVPPPPAPPPPRPAVHYSHYVRHAPEPAVVAEPVAAQPPAPSAAPVPPPAPAVSHPVAAPETKYQLEKQSFIAAWGNAVPAGPVRVPVAKPSVTAPPPKPLAAVAKPAAPIKPKPVSLKKPVVPTKKPANSLMPNGEYQNEKQNFIKAWGGGT